MATRHGWILGLLAVMALTTPAFALTVSPGAAPQGGIYVFSIHTPGAGWSDGVTVNLGAGTITRSVTRTSPELLMVEVAITADAVLGPRDVVVEEEGAVVVGRGALQVVPAGTVAGPPAGGDPLAVNAIINPGFETGSMVGWIPVTWSISTVLPHGGVYDAYDPGGSGGGGQCLRQDFSPSIDSDTISSFTFWLRQPDDGGIAQVAVWHQNSGTQYGVIFTNDDDSWTFGTFTGLVVPNDFVTAIHICGFGGGYPTPDDSWADDFVLETSGATAVEPSTWGGIKAALR